MTDRPIIFSAPMVRALLDGRKTQTRRLLTHARVFATPEQKAFTLRGDALKRALQGAARFRHLGGTGWFWEADAFEWQAPATRTGWMANITHSVGDRLYVREHWRADACYDDLSPSSMGGEEGVRYEADGAFGSWTFGPRNPGRHRQGMHMPRWASRLTLTLTDVRVQRLQEISEADARAEGVKPTGWEGSDVPCHCRIAFRDLWNSLHRKADERWEDNPWIYALTFSVEQRNIDQ